MSRRAALALVYLALLLASWLVRQGAEAPATALSTATLSAVGGPGEVRLALRDEAGSGPDAPLVLLLHGSPGDHRAMDGLTDSLGDDLRRVAPDLPGFGASTREIPDYSVEAHARYLLAWMDQQGIESADWVGFSMGGGVALSAARLAPERVRSLSLVSAIGVQELELLGRYELNHAVHGAQLAAIWALTEGVPHFGVLDRFDLNLAYARNFYDTDQRPLRQALADYPGPVLIVHGERDPLVPAAAAREHHRISPQSELVMLDTNHFAVFMEPERVAGPLRDFLGRVHRGEATLRSGASPERIAAAQPPYDPREAGPLRGMALFVALALFAVATLVSEDLSCIGAGLLVASGRLPFFLASLGCGVGIFVGDILLFLAGLTLGRLALRHPPLSWWVSEAEVARASAFFQARGFSFVLLSRFMPGTRLPTYFAAGMLRTSFWAFTGFFAASVAVWTPLLVGASALLGEATLTRVANTPGAAALPILAAVGLLFVVRNLPPLFTWRGRRLALGRWRRLRHWEFWPMWAVYPPVIAYLVWLSIRHRSPMAFTAVNPGIHAGGVVGESKISILRSLESTPEFCLKMEVISASLSPETRGTAARAAMRTLGLDWPVVVKPDAGQRGLGVAIVRSEEELQAALSADTDRDFILQQFAPGEEFGVFYVRKPNNPRGFIFSITHKKPLDVVGDGRRNLEALILADERAVCLAPAHLRRHAARLAWVPAAGERVRLIELGTHSMGSVFLDAGELVTPELSAAIDRLARGFDGFYFGRFDIRVPDIPSFQRGEGLRVVELNGVTSESTNMYDPRHSVLFGWKTLMEQWRLAYEIGAMNARNGTLTVGPWALFLEYLRFKRGLRG